MGCRPRVDAFEGIPKRVSAWQIPQFLKIGDVEREGANCDGRRACLASFTLFEDRGDASPIRLSLKYRLCEGLPGRQGPDTVVVGGVSCGRRVCVWHQP